MRIILNHLSGKKQFSAGRNPTLVMGGSKIKAGDSKRESQAV